MVEERGAMPSFLSRSARLNDLGFYFNQTFDDFQASLQDRDRLELNHLGFAVIKRRTRMVEYAISSLALRIKKIQGLSSNMHHLVSKPQPPLSP